MNPKSNALKKNLNAEGTHSNISSNLFDIIFMEANDAYRNLLRRRILDSLMKVSSKENSEGLKIGKGAVRCRPPFAPYVSTHLSYSPNTLSNRAISMKESDGENHE